MKRSSCSRWMGMRFGFGIGLDEDSPETNLGMLSSVLRNARSCACFSSVDSNEASLVVVVEDE